MNEISILKEYVPADLDDSVVIEKVTNFIKDNNLEKKDFGRIMWTMNKELAGKFDNSKLKDIINNILNLI